METAGGSGLSAEEKQTLGVKLYAEGRFPEALATLDEALQGAGHTLRPGGMIWARPLSPAAT
jgi:hypothetical protein